MKTIHYKADLCVVGGGLAGLCCAIAAARHGICHIIAESFVWLKEIDVYTAVWRIVGEGAMYVDFKYLQQDPHLAENQK